MNKIALFDFCETLANFQTADPFVDYVRKNHPSKRMLFFDKLKLFHDRLRIFGAFEHLLLPQNSISKKIKLYQLKGFHKKELVLLAEQYYKNVVKPNLINEMINELLRLKNEYKIYLVSGGYDLYLKYFVEDFGLDGYFSSKIGFIDDICTGRMEGEDCMYENKVKTLENSFNKAGCEIIAYSDSKTDMPLLAWADEGIVVSKKHSQKWAKDNKLKEIIWYE